MNWQKLAWKPILKAKNVMLNLHRLGLSRTIKLYKYRIHESYRDRQLGICTTGYIEADLLGHGKDCVAYEPINYRCLDILFEHLRPDGNDVFLDYGCGKGRALLTAATYPYRRVIGIELSTELGAIARQNAQLSASKLKCLELELVIANATTYVVPPDVTTVFLFNPFTGDVLAEVQRQIYQSIQEFPRRVRVVYMYPEGRLKCNQFENCHWLSKPTELPAADWADEVKLLVYESNLLPSADAGNVLIGANSV